MVDALQDQARYVCLELPLYGAVENIKDKNGETVLLYRLRQNEVKFDTHCIHCNRSTPFKTERGKSYYDYWLMARNNYILEGNIFTLHMHCQREKSHIYTYIFTHNSEYIVKIGQYPSLEDIANNDIRRFRPVLEKLDFSELHKAGGLASHGLGIASFVYLRRIFERLITRHYDTHRAEKGEVENWNSLRIVEKIAAISDTLPRVLVENRQMYSILSAGIHELDEEACKNYFPVLKAGVVAILEEDLQAKEKARAAEELRNSIATLASMARKAPDG